MTVGAVVRTVPVLLDRVLIDPVLSDPTRTSVVGSLVSLVVRYTRTLPDGAVTSLLLRTVVRTVIVSPDITVVGVTVKDWTVSMVVCLPRCSSARSYVL